MGCADDLSEGIEESRKELQAEEPGSIQKEELEPWLVKIRKVASELVGH